MSDPVCPDAASHTRHPAGYVAHSEWAEAMAETHTQRLCPGCGRWEIWEPNMPGVEPLDPDAFASICIVGWRYRRNDYVTRRSQT